MIAKGNLHGDGANLAAYLTRSFADERAELFELRGFAATNIREAFLDVQIQAAATKATKPFFHAYVRAPEGEKLTREQWQTFADRLEGDLGFDGQPRAIAFHHKAGESHMHVAWSRVDLASLTVIDPGLYKKKMKQLCREFEAEFDLTRVPNERGENVKTQSAERPEFEQARRLNTDLNAIRNTIHDCWQSADSGRAFAAALAEHDLILARGDRRDFVVIDPAGGDHALSKRITGATAAETRQRMADIDRASLPSVRNAKTQQAQRKQTMSDTEAPESDQDPASYAAQRDRLVREAAQLAEAERAQAQMPSARSFREQMEREAEEAKKNEKERQQKDADRAAAGDITDAHSRYAQALGSTYNIRDPYGSMANAAMAEYGSFHRQQDDLRKEAAAEKDPDKRRLIDLRREIEGHDYMTITSQRLAGISRATTMNKDAGANDEALAKTHADMAREKRQERTDLQRELKERQKDERAATERGGLGSAAQQGSAAQERERNPRRSKAEIAMQTTAGRYAQPTKEDEAARTVQRQQEETKQREGLKPDQPIETALPTEVGRRLSKLEEAVRNAAGRNARDPSEAPRDGGRPQGRPRGGGGRGR